MLKHHIENLAEQIANKGHGSAPFHHVKDPYLAKEVVVPEGSSIQLRAYQIHEEKGGTAMDNWLEAERDLGNIDKAVSRLINEGDPNTQRLQTKGKV